MNWKRMKKEKWKWDEIKNIYNWLKKKLKIIKWEILIKNERENMKWELRN